MTSRHFSPLRRTVCAAALAFALPAAMAWTDKPVHMLVPAPAGGTMDVVARILADQLSAEIGQPVLVENKPGAGGAIAVQAMLAAPLDGNTIMMTASNILTEIPHVMKTAFDPLKDVKPVTAIARSSMVMVGAPNVPAKDVKGVVAWVKANPGKVSFASYSAGTSSQYAGAILNQKAGLDMQHVPFAGSPPGLVQVMGGQIPLMFDGMVTSKKMIEAGKIQAFGVAAKKRSPHLPNVPTMAEQGYPEIDFGNWVGIIVASGVPSAMVQKINVAVDKAAAHPKIKDRLLGAGFDLGGDETSEQMVQSLRAEFERNAAIVKSFDIKLNQ
ncbi:tripartite tricarboxylate transporter substrate binding protein [Hydrogenophaga sp.]|uniref:tripartite tricarboxylate transporter substrate binding protein n=1 Tax=Hydrogenophaga sp. TaxID=1904254 RepID=UPI00286DEC08|nr:tripartite tricarboxylate transporter substrate binding protein [Hydrogenophaga sp.]